MQNQTDPNQNNLGAQQISDVPPMPDFSNANTVSTTASNTPPQSNFFPPNIPTSPAKNTSKGRIIATFLGVLLLIGGITAGILIIRNPQLLKQQAATIDYSIGTPCTVYGQLKCSDSFDKLLACAGGTWQVSSFCALNGMICTTSTGTPSCQTPSAGGGGTSNCTIDGCPGWQDAVATNNVCINLNPGVCPSPTFCTHTNECANGYTCIYDTGECVANPEIISCGRDLDPGAPVCCTAGTSDASCLASGGQLTCEAPYRKECVTYDAANGTKWCFLGTDTTYCAGFPGPTATPGGGGGSPPPPPPPTSTPQPTPSPTPLPSPTPGPTALCTGVKAYDGNWIELSTTQLSSLTTGNSVYFCVAGTTDSGSFDMARFTVNTVLQAVTTLKRPTTNDFCQTYTIPANVYTFNVTAEIHHVILGWIGP